MQIKNLMSEDIITIDKDQNLSDALKLLRKHNVSRLPVTNNKELVGIISERDIAAKLGSSKYESMPASRLHISSVMVKDVFTVPETMQLDEVFDKITVKEIMTKDLTVVSPTERLVHARRLMIEDHVGRLPVVEDDELVGMLTSKDLMRAFIDFRKKVPEKYQKSQIKEVLVEYIMSSNPTVTSRDATISEVANVMIETGYNGLPVVEGNDLVGIITQTDILRLIEKLES